MADNSSDPLLDALAVWDKAQIFDPNSGPNLEERKLLAAEIKGFRKGKGYQQRSDPEFVEAVGKLGIDWEYYAYAENGMLSLKTMQYLYGLLIKLPENIQR